MGKAGRGEIIRRGTTLKCGVQPYFWYYPTIIMGINTLKLGSGIASARDDASRCSYYVWNWDGSHTDIPFTCSNLSRYRSFKEVSRLVPELARLILNA